MTMACCLFGLLVMAWHLTTKSTKNLVETSALFKIRRCQQIQWITKEYVKCGQVFGHLVLHGYLMIYMNPLLSWLQLKNKFTIEAIVFFTTRFPGLSRNMPEILVRLTEI